MDKLYMLYSRKFILELRSLLMKREIWRDIPIVVQQYFACDLHLKNVLSAPWQKLIWQSMTSTIFTCNVFFFFFCRSFQRIQLVQISRMVSPQVEHWVQVDECSYDISTVLGLAFITLGCFHCVKSVQIRSFFLSVFSCIRTRKNTVFGHFSRNAL